MRARCPGAREPSARNDSRTLEREFRIRPPASRFLQDRFLSWFFILRDRGRHRDSGVLSSWRITRSDLGARLTLWPSSCNLVGYYGCARTNMESARALKRWHVLVCGAAMLSHVLRPRFNHEILDVPAGLGDIREQAPEYRSVTIPNRSQRVHGVSKVCSSSRVDLVFYGDHNRARISLDLAGYLRRGHEAQRF